MPETYGNEHVTLKLRIREAGEEMKQRLRPAVMRAAEELKARIQRNLSVPTRTVGPSAPGEMPHADTGVLRNSITWKMVGDLTAVVGTKLNYGIWLEFGVQGEKTVYAGPGKVFHWVDRNGRDVFVKSFTYRGLAARPFLRPSLDQMFPRIQAIIQRASNGKADIERAT